MFAAVLLYQLYIDTSGFYRGGGEPDQTIGGSELAVLQLQPLRFWAASRLDAQGGPPESPDEAGIPNRGSITLVSVIRDEPDDLDDATENNDTMRGDGMVRPLAE